ncbi:hypothetical protein SBV1_740036 [Verrucomicrobia bacterium]|nr:hypothetical protein SBV1_740036 [Verrucomicrobiota bacterium]
MSLAQLALCAASGLLDATLHFEARFSGELSCGFVETAFKFARGSLSNVFCSRLHNTTKPTPAPTWHHGWYYHRAVSPQGRSTQISINVMRESQPDPGPTTAWPVAGVLRTAL